MANNNLTLIQSASSSTITFISAGGPLTTPDALMDKSIPTAGNYAYLMSVDQSYISTFDYTNEFTISVWFKTDQQAATSAIDEPKTMDLISIGDWSTDQGFSLQLTSRHSHDGDGADADGSFYVAVNLGTVGELYLNNHKGTAVNDNQWHNFVVTYNPSRKNTVTGKVGISQTVLMYVDGVRLNHKGEQSPSIGYDGTFNNSVTNQIPSMSAGSSSSNIFTVGDRRYQTAGGGVGADEMVYPFAGQISDIRVWNRALTDGLEALSALSATDTYGQTQIRPNPLSASGTYASGEIGCLWNNGYGDYNTTAGGCA